MNRRTLIQLTGWTLGGLGLATGLYAWQVEPFLWEFVRKKMPVRNLPASLRGKTLLQISDLHVGNRFDYRYLMDALRKAQKLEPDFVAYTGDYVTYENEAQFGQLEEVLAHAVHGKLGTVGILGNHDYGKDYAQPKVAARVTELLTRHGIRVLRNERTEVAGLQLIGIDDLWGPNFDPVRALTGYRPEQPSVALCHNPDVCDLDVWNGYRGWILSGHTHGGQCKPPFLPPPLLPVKNHRYSAGEFDLFDGRTLYINRALGHLYQLRFNVRPEITVFELTA